MENATKKMVIQIGNVIGLISVIIVNILANLLPINNKTTQVLSDQYPNLFVPAGITFSIWGVIYLLLLMFVMYQAQDVFSKKKKNLPFLDHIHLLFLLSCLVNILWILFWHYEFLTLSLMTMFILFVVLLLIYLRLDIGKGTVSLKERFLVQVPFSVYLGWITVATIANVTAVLVSIGWDGGGLSEATWAILVIIIGLIITAGVLVTRRDIAYGLVIVWAYLGIYLKQEGSVVGGDVALTALVCLSLIFVGVIVLILLKVKEMRGEKNKVGRVS